ncbi:hypothetical protein Hanom_Chr03g00212361 [Helianthus anomalus]
MSILSLSVIQFPNLDIFSPVFLLCILHTFRIRIIGWREIGTENRSMKITFLQPLNMVFLKIQMLQPSGFFNFIVIRCDLYHRQ